MTSTDVSDIPYSEPGPLAEPVVICTSGIMAYWAAAVEHPSRYVTIDIQL